jgi:hypothetical protein
VPRYLAQLRTKYFELLWFSSGTRHDTSSKHLLSSTHFSAPMLQRRAQGATRKSLAGKKARCKLFYTTTARAVEQPTKDGLNAFISEDVSNPEIKSLDQEDIVARGVYLALSPGFVVQNC